MRPLVQVGEQAHKTVLLQEVNPEARAPYHLINATLNLPSSEHASLRDRRSDFFLFSKHWTVPHRPATRGQTVGWRAIIP